MSKTCYTCAWGGSGEEINDLGPCWLHNGEVDFHQPPKDQGCDEWIGRKSPIPPRLCASASQHTPCSQRPEGEQRPCWDNLDRLLSMSERLEIWRVPSGKIAVSFQNCDIKNGDFLESVHGEGNTFYEAVDDYMKLVSGKCLVFRAYSKMRREVSVL